MTLAPPCSLPRSKRHETSVERYLAQREARFVREFTAQPVGNAAGPCRLLDLCSGDGRAAGMLAQRGVLVVGLDLDPAALAAFRARRDGLAVPVQADALRAPLAGDELDCVVALHCFDQLDRIGFLQECRRLLRRGGWLIFDALNRHSYKWLLKRLRHRPGEHSSAEFQRKWIDVLSCSELLAASQSCGFEVRAVQGYNWAPVTLEGDGVLVGVSACAERLLQLERCARISPRLLVAACKN